MDKNIILQIKSDISEASQINAVKLWNNNLINNQDLIKRFPIAFLEIKNITFETIALNAQECNEGSITVHIIYKTLDDEDLNIFDVSQDVFSTLQKKGYNRKTERADYEGGEIIDWQIDFEIPRFKDEASIKDYTLIDKPPIDITDE